MSDELQLDLPPETRRLLSILADAGVVGANEADVAAYLILRGLDDMMRCGVIKLGPN